MFKLLFTFFLFLAESMLGGFFLNLYWGWFIIPVFDTIKMTYPQAVGVWFFLAYVKANFATVDNRHKEMTVGEIFEACTLALLTSTIYYGLAGVIIWYLFT